MIWSFIDRLASVDPDEGEGQRWRGRFITVLNSLGSAASVVMGMVFAIQRNWLDLISAPMGLVFCMGLQWAWRKTRSAATIANAFGIFATTLYFAGFVVHRQLSMVAWLAVMPLLVLFLGGRRLGVIWLVIESAVVFAAASVLSVLPPPSTPVSAGADAAMTSMAALMVIVFAVGLIFDFSANSVLDQLREANAAKSRFLANVSHELRTPMNGILGMAEVIAQHELSKEQSERLVTVIQSSQHLRVLIDDMLHATQLDGEKLELNVGPVVPSEVAATTLKQFAPLAEAKRLKLSLDITGRQEPLLTDASRLMQVLSNLVGNAVKFTREGQIQVSVVTHDEGDTMQLSVRVRDTGPGLSSAEIETLFRPFARLRRDAQVQGAGLGLAIAKRVAEGLGGRITVKSTLGVGSVFAFEMTAPKADIAQPEPAPAWSGVRVLVVDDNPINVRVATALLEKLGCQVVGASDGAQGVKRFSESKFALVLMDLHMPVMDGFEAARRIHALDPGVTMFAVTASSVKEELDAVTDVGMQGYLCKPIQMEDLKALLRRQASALKAG
jgi:signal transduction histidine kinase